MVHPIGGSPGGFPPPPVNHVLTDEQKATAKEIVSSFDAEAVDP